MKQEKLVKAYMVLDKLAKVSFPLSISNKIFHMKDALQTQYDFQCQEETKSFNENHGSFNDQGKMIFPSMEEYKAFESKMEELRNLDIDITITPIEIPVNDNIVLSADEIKNLIGFINFV